MSRKQLGERITSTDTAADDRSATILHVDMDAFFVGVELLERPELRGVPVIVGGTGARGVVSSASYEARALGVHAAMPMARALQLVPNATVIGANMAKYKAASTRVMEIFREFTPRVEPLSIDEAFLDVSGAGRLFGPARQIAARIRKEVHERTGLTCSVGAASTKFVAKLASGKCKPNGLLVIPHAETIPFLHALPVGALWGVGGITEKKLHGRGIHTVFDLAHTPKTALTHLVGARLAELLNDLAWGRDARAVEPLRREKSVSHEQTFAVDLTSHAELRREVRAQADAVAVRLRKAGLVAATVAVKLRWGNFETVSRQVRLQRPSDTGLVLFRAAVRLLDELHPEGRGVRLIGVRAADLQETERATGLMLWDEEHTDQWQAAERAADAASAKFGRQALRPASLLGRFARRDGGEELSDQAPRAATFEQ